MSVARAWFAVVSVIGLLPSLVAAQEATARSATRAPVSDASPFLVAPYLQLGHNPARDSVTLLWHTADCDATWSVEIQPGHGLPAQKVCPTARPIRVAGVAAHRVYQATITGLEPGSRFRYAVSKDDRVVFSAEAHAPKSPGQPYRFLAFGDCGAGSTEQKSLALRAFQFQPDLVVIPGDIVYEGGTILEYRANFWPVYNADQPSDLGAPLLRSALFVAATGNHDTADSRDLDKDPDGLAYFHYWDQPLNGLLGKEGGPLVPLLKGSEPNRRAFLSAASVAYPRMTNFSFDYGNTHWTVLDSNPYVDWTDAELQSWIASDLAAASRATWRFVVFHHPGFSSAREHYEQQHMRLLSPLFEAGKVDIVYSGHVHNYQRSYPLHFTPDKKGTLLVGGRDGKTVRGRVVNGRWRLDKSFDGRTNTTPHGVIYIVTGAGGKTLYNPEQQADPDSWQKFTDRFISTVHSITVADVDGNRLTVRQVAADGKELDHFLVTK